MTHDNQPPVYARDVASGALPLAIAFAEHARTGNGATLSNSGSRYETYTTESGSAKSLDDAPLKDED